MTTKTHTPANEGETWIVPCLRMRLPDGSYLIKTSKPVLRATSSQTAKITGVSKKNLALLADVGYIRRARPTPHTVFYYPGEVEAFIRKTEEDPDFWTQARRDAYITTRRLREGRRDQTGEEGEG